MFYKTISILQKTESHILDLPSDNKLWSIFTRHLVFPIKYMLLGIKEFFRPTSIWSLIAFGFLIVFALAISKTEIPNHYQLYIYNFCLYFPIILVVFSVPSTYSLYGVKKIHVEHAKIIILSENVKTTEEIELLESCVEKIEKRILSRVVFYNWLIGAFWALYIIILNFELRIAFRGQEKDIAIFVTESFTSFAIMLVSVIFALFLVSSYKKSSEILIKSIEFGSAEIKYDIIKNT